MSAATCVNHENGTAETCERCATLRQLRDERIARDKYDSFVRAHALRDRHAVAGVSSPSAVSPSDASDASAGIDHLNEKTIAWSAVVEPGIRMHLELAVSGEGELYVEGVSFTNVGDPAVPGPGGLDDRDLPIGDPSPIGSSVSDDPHALAESEREGGRGHGDEHASPDVHVGDATALARFARRAWFGSELVRITVSAERAA